MTLGARLRLYRKEKGMTQSELAELIGVSTQAVSKWETDAGMPDIGQIVPLVGVLGVSADALLGLAEATDEGELAALREQVQHDYVRFGRGEAEHIYGLAGAYLAQHPTNAEVAFWCLESLVELVVNGGLTMEPRAFIGESERYRHCILRYEQDADRICKHYFVMARAYRFVGDHERAAEATDKLPDLFGDKTYWEAEFAFADGNMALALQKCKTSFADKARYMARCIRLARMISETVDGEEALADQLALDEYMLTILDAVLSGGDFLPYRQIYQKLSLLAGMAKKYARSGDAEQALRCAKQTVKTRDAFFAFLDAPGEKHCLMFDEADDDGSWHVTREAVEKCVSSAIRALSVFPAYTDESAVRAQLGA